MDEKRDYTYGFQHTPNIAVEPIPLSIPVFDFQPAFHRFDGPGDVCVDPEWPERVVEIEDDDFRQGQPVCEGRGPCRLLGQRSRGRGCGGVG